MDPCPTFRAPHYLNINHARMMHLHSLGLDLKDRTILELGAGIGDITAYLVSMGCRLITRVEARPENCDVMRREHPEHPVICDDLMHPCDLSRGYDVAIAYGILYHLQDPRPAIGYMARHCEKFAVVETCVSLGQDLDLNPVSEGAHDPSQAAHGIGSRPTRKWMQQALKSWFAHVYCPVSQPAHPQFPLDWLKPTSSPLTRAIFVCSKQPLINDLLVERLPDTHIPYGYDAKAAP